MIPQVFERKIAKATKKALPVAISEAWPRNIFFPDGREAELTANVFAPAGGR